MVMAKTEILNMYPPQKKNTGQPGAFILQA